jgi:predicted phage tail protein
VLQTILGAVLVVVGAVLNFTPLAAASPFFYQVGGAMIIGGVIQMLSPQPAGLASKQDADNKASYAFGSVTNTAAQGYPVPWVMESAVSVVQLFLPGFTLKTSNKNTSI